MYVVVTMSFMEPPPSLAAKLAMVPSPPLSDMSLVPLYMTSWAREGAASTVAHRVAVSTMADGRIARMGTLRVGVARSAFEGRNAWEDRVAGSPPPPPAVCDARIPPPPPRMQRRCCDASATRAARGPPTLADVASRAAPDARPRAPAERPSLTDPEPPKPASLGSDALDDPRGTASSARIRWAVVLALLPVAPGLPLVEPHPTLLLDPTGRLHFLYLRL